MKTTRLLMIILSLGVFALISASNAVAQTRSGARASNRQMQTLLVRIETKIDILKEESQRFADRGGNNGSTQGQQLGDYLVTLEQSTAKLRAAMDARQPLDDEVTDVLNNATTINRFMAANRVTTSAQSQWLSLKTDLTTLGTYNGVSWNLNWTVRPVTSPIEPGYPTTVTPAYTVSDAQMQTLLSRIALKTDIYKRQMNAAPNQGQRIDVNRERTVSLSSYISGFENATARLKQRFDARQSASADASEVLTRATYIDQYMSRNTVSQSPQAQAQWRNLRGDLNTLAGYYRVSWNWSQALPANPDGPSTGGTGRGFDARLTGTYRLNPGLSDDTAAIIDRALGSSTAAQNQNSRTSLERRLRPPEMIAIEKNNTTVSLASSILPQVTFEADGVARTETNSRGRTISTTATADRDGLIINYQGERANDFYVTFTPTREGGQLKVTRRIYVESSSEPITASSVYDKIDTIARWTMVNDGNNGRVGAGVPTISNDAFVIPNGMRLNAVLREPISTYSNQQNGRFMMEVTSPTQYRGALISGRIVNEDTSNRIAGRTRVLLNFDTITLPGGQSYRFSGTIDTVLAANGDNITINNNAAVRNGNQNTRGVGSILGAILGAIGGQPATNVEAEAGTILTQGRDNMDLGQGSRFTITSGSPSSVGSLR